LKNPEPERFVTGHDFSRADKGNQINGALGHLSLSPIRLRQRPEERMSCGAS
jgi:hypothetical protein